MSSASSEVNKRLKCASFFSNWLDKTKTMYLHLNVNLRSAASTKNHITEAQPVFGSSLKGVGKLWVLPW